MDVPPIHLVTAAITSVTLAMRKNSRWSHASLYSGVGSASRLAHEMGLRTLLGADAADARLGREGSSEELMAGFVGLRRMVVENPADLPPLPMLISPFLALIRSPLTTGPITSQALAALLSLLSIFPSELPAGNEAAELELTQALSDISSAVTHCKFEASDSQGDEVVLLKILEVLDVLVKRWGGRDGRTLLGDREVCEMLETGLGMCCQMRLSELLRRTAESTVQTMVRIVFEYLKTLEPPPASELPAEPATDAESAPATNIMDPTGIALADESVPESLQTTEDALAPTEASAPTADSPLAPASETHPEELTEQAGPVVFVPYGPATPTELIRVLITLLNPSDPQHTDSMRLAALGILNTALEVAGTHLGRWPEIRGMLSDEGCKYLLQLTRSDSPALFSFSLRVTSTIFETMREGLKPQMELFLSYLIDRLTPPPSALHPSQRPMSTHGSTSSSMDANEEKADLAVDVAPRSRHPVGVGLAANGESRELLLECLAQLARHPSFLVDLWLNYDCDMDCEDLFEKTVGFLTRGIYPSQPTSGYPQQVDSQFICLDILLAAVGNMADRVETGGAAWPSTYPSSEAFIATKNQKRILLVGAARFNIKPKDGLAYLEQHGLLKVRAGQTKAQAIATLLKTCPRLDKTLLGDYLSRPDNVEILQTFMGLFDFSDKSVADAMRDFLEAFRLPGESQQIARITETFAAIFFAANPGEIKSEDAVYVLAYSIIMLNTDLFNPQNRTRMSFEDYRRNLRGVNAGADFSDAFLHEIYDSIKKREIIMPEEHTGQLGFDYAWKELLARAPKAGPLLSCNTSALDADMFTVVSKQVVSSIAYAFATFNDDYIVQRSIHGFRQLATLAVSFHLPEVFDHIVTALSQTTGLLDDRDPSQASLNNPVVEVEGQTLTVSGLSVRFGINVRCQLAAVVLFTITNGNGNFVRDGWIQIFEIYQTLFLHSLLPKPMLQMEDFLGGTTMIPLQVALQPDQQKPRQKDVGLLSTLSSYLLSPYGSNSDTPRVPTCTDSEVEATLSAVDCLNSCRFEELYGQIINLKPGALLSAVRALKDLADRRLTAAAQPQKGNSRGRDTPAIRGAGPSSAHSGQNAYDPASVFLMEMLVSIASRAKAHVVETWPLVFDHLLHILSTAESHSILLIERAVVGLLRLCSAISREPAMQRQLASAVNLLRTLPPSILSSVVEGTGQSAEDLLRKLQGIESESAATQGAATGQTEPEQEAVSHSSAVAAVEGEETAPAEQTFEKEVREMPAPEKMTAA